MLPSPQRNIVCCSFKWERHEDYTLLYREEIEGIRATVIIRNFSSVKCNGTSDKGIIGYEQSRLQRSQLAQSPVIIHMSTTRNEKNKKKQRKLINSNHPFLSSRYTIINKKPTSYSLRQ